MLKQGKIEKNIKKYLKMTVFGRERLFLVTYKTWKSGFKSFLLKGIRLCILLFEVSRVYKIMIRHEFPVNKHICPTMGSIPVKGGREHF